MKKLTFESEYKTYSISHPLDETKSYCLYCIDSDLVCNIIDDILTEYNIEVYNIDYNTGMTKYLCLIDVAYNTNDEIMHKALQKIVNTISYKRYMWRD